MIPMSRTCLVLALGLAACGGTPSAAHGPEQVTTTWTAGDDAPLDPPSDQSRRGDQPGGPKR